MNVTPLTNTTGAEVRGIDLGRPISQTDKATLNRAFVDHSVLVIRDQHLTPQQIVAAVGLFGTIFPQHNTRFALPDCPQIHYLSNQDRFPDGRRYIPGEGWHTDHSNDARPPKAMQDRIGGLLAIHVYQSSHSGRRLMPLSDANKERIPNAVLHPMVRTHPESGRKAIYINPIRIEGILGLDHKEALPLLAELLEHATTERFQYRHQWRPGDLVMWDNRCLLHKANGDYDMDQTRYLYRVMLQGDVPH